MKCRSSARQLIARKGDCALKLFDARFVVGADTDFSVPLIHERERERLIQEEKFYEESERRRSLFFELEEHKRRVKEAAALVKSQPCAQACAVHQHMPLHTSKYRTRENSHHD